MDETMETGRAILREISPWRRFFRNWAFYVLSFATTLGIVASPEAWPWYLLIFLSGTIILAVSTIFEEVMDGWFNRISAT